MSSSSKLDDMFASLPLPAKIWMFLWTYLAVSGWFSTYMLISKIGEARRIEMLETLIPREAFVWTVAVMMISSLIVIGLLFYGRYTRKKKEVVKAAVKKLEETNVYVEPKMKFDPSVLLFWIGGSILNVLFSLCILTVIVGHLAVTFEPQILYILIGFIISFFIAIAMFLITQVMANGVLDAKHYGDEINRSWVFRTIGYGHDASQWRDMFSALRMIGYDHVVSIEHEDSLMTSTEGLEKAIAFLKDVMIHQPKPTAMHWA